MSASHAVLRRADYAPPAYLVETVHLHVSLAVEPRTVVRAKLRLRRNPVIPAAAPLQLDGAGLETRRVSLDGVELSPGRYRIEGEKLTIEGAPDACVLETEVVIDPEKNTALEGLYATSAGYLTQCEAEGFRKITWYPDRPDVLARFTTEIEADPARFPVCLANGNAAGVVDLPDGRRRFRFVDPFPKPCYLFALVAGDFACLEDTFTTRSGRKVRLRIWAEAKDLAKCGYAMGALQRAMRWDEDAFGLECDLDDYGVVVTDAFNMGAMENKGLNVFNSQYVLASPATATDDDYGAVEGVIGHEYFHNWTGNRITCRDWFQLSLKEGLTVFRDQEFSAAMGSPAIERIDNVRRLRAAQFPEDAGPLAHPVRPDEVVEINNFYTATVYEKGAEVVRMLHTLLGAAGFRAGMDLYVRRHDGQAVTCDDFAQAMADANGRDLAQFRRWYAQAGTPVLDVAARHDSEAETWTLRVTQHTPPTPGQPDKQPLHLPLALGLLDRDGGEIPLRLRGEPPAAAAPTRVLEVTEAESTFVFEGVPREPVPSLLRGFSAPVHLRYPYDRDQLAFLLAHDRDSFARWDAGQKLALDVMLEMVGKRQQGRDAAVDPRLVEACRALFAAALRGEPGLDRALVAEALVFPGEAMVGDAMAVVDVDAIHAVREAVRVAIAAGARQELAELHARLRAEAPAEYATTSADVARRRLMHVCLSYRMALRDDAVYALAAEQCASASNMTDTMSALVNLAHSPAPAPTRQAVLDAFLRRWQHEALVVDKWLRVQASAPHQDVLTQVQQLLRHEAFTLANPNKVRALLGTFAGNQVRFHAADGAGYAFLAEQILALDPLNPQVAARIAAGAFGRWRRFDAGRQAHAKAQLERIGAGAGLSRDVGEIVRKALAG